MTEWRVNAFPAKCCMCGTTIEERQGYYRVDPSEGRKMYCVTHKEAYDLDPTIQPEPSFTAKAGGGIDIDTLAQRTADLTFAKVAEHFVATVGPGVEKALPAMVSRELAKLVRIEEIKIGKMPPVKIDKAHKMLPLIVRALVCGGSPFLVGPAGSGKTTLARQCAKVLKVNFYFASRVENKYELLGFRTASGETVRTSFREAYEHGGLFLFDEVDASEAQAFTSFNAALDNGFCDFPDGMVERHKDFYAVAAGNTYGRGADRQYVGRTQLDAATLDRFQIFDMGYDEQLENEISGDLDWAAYVQRVRHAIEQQQIRHIVSPRATLVGARFLAGGMDRKDVEDSCIWKGLEAGVRQRIEYAMASGA